MTDLQQEGTHENVLVDKRQVTKRRKENASITLGSPSTSTGIE